MRPVRRVSRVPCTSILQGKFGNVPDGARSGGLGVYGAGACTELPKYELTGPLLSCHESLEREENSGEVVHSLFTEVAYVAYRSKT